ncbi:MAG: FAD-dependent oxidoreductase [Clostridiales bacterium]|nr:FAD-dependent oxidoreductase [Clostridiales bacterium]
MIHRSEIFGFDTIEHEADICIVGAGAAGLFAAVAAARHGAKVALMHDRPVLGGNASSEVRMWRRGAHGRDNKETGLVEELALANIRRNPTLNFSILDSVTYEMVINEPNIDLMLNCSCLDAEMKDGKIVSVKGWQTTTQRFHTVRAKLFADCSGDSVLAPLTGAEFRMGRESCDEFGEDIAPKESDNRTMGMSCLIQVRETDHEVPFIAPDWATKFTDETISHRVNINNPRQFVGDNFWWMELGGMVDSIGDTEEVCKELLKVAFGVWDYYKNSGRFESKNWELDWVGFLPGKRESRRYVGDHILTQNEVRGEGRFNDLIAYGGWSMDDHNPGGFNTKEAATIFHPAPSPFGIPYRCLYSVNVPNLMFSGRNISCTHTAMSSCRVMSTCATLGQAMGTAAAIAINRDTTPRGVYENYIDELKQTLMEDDCYLPFNRRSLTPAMEGAKASVGGKDAAVLFDGVDRTIDGESHLLECAFGDDIEITLPESRKLSKIAFIFDSDINRDSFTGVNGHFKTYPMRCNTELHEKLLGLPDTLLRDFDLYIDSGDGEYKLAAEVKDNYRRLWSLEGELEAKRIKLTPKSAYGAENAHVYSVILK